MNKKSAAASVFLLGITLGGFQNCSQSLPASAQNFNSTASANNTDPSAACMLDGNSVVSGTSASVVPSLTVPFGSVCPAAVELICTNGLWTGGFADAYSTCTVDAPPATNLTLSANTTNYSIFQAAGSPTTAVTVILTINSGVTVGATATSAAAIDTGAFPAGSTISIINNGTIQGAGGKGGAGADVYGSPGAGGAGGPAITLEYPVSITNAGVIEGGGGGGQGGITNTVYISDGYYTAVGSGGGGGCGSVGGKGGAGVNEILSIGAAGGAGSTTSGGAGGSNPYSNSGFAGGACGSAGKGAHGGAAGNAVTSNGNAVTWVSGNASPNILGPIN